MKKIFFIITLLLFSLTGYAQLEVKPGSFKEVPGFVNINTDIYEDGNNVLYSVIKVNTKNIDDEQRHRLVFRGNESTFIELEYKVGEVWVYLSSKPATYLKISHPEYGSTEFWFPFDLEPKKGYEMLLVNNSASSSSGSGTLTVTTRPESGAKIKLNGTVLAYKTPFTYDMIAAGHYEVTVSKDKYKSVTKTIDINDGDNQTLDIEMPSDVAVITINADEETDVYIDGNYMKKGTWSGELVGGRHELYLEKQIYMVAKKTIEVEPGKDQIINLNLSTDYAEITFSAARKLSIDGKEYYNYSSSAPTVKLSPGLHKIILIHRYHYPDTLMIRAVAGQPATYETKPKPIVGKVSINTEPSGATVFIDDKEYGVTPTEYSVNMGDAFRIRIEKEGYISLTSQRVMIDINERFIEINQTLTKISSNANVINEVYSVAPNYKVYFAKGNVQYQPSTRKWRFAEHQWDVIGDANKNISETYSGWVDLLSYSLNDDADYYSVEGINATYEEWRKITKKSAGNEGFTWRVLTQDEWDYVFNKRQTDSGINYVWATVNGVKGIVLLPDSWSVSYYLLQKPKENQNRYSDNIISLSDWNTKLEANGAVFLPVCGIRRKATVDSAGIMGYYWSCYPCYDDNKKEKGAKFYDMFVTRFSDSEGVVNVQDHAPGRYGLSVRPVCQPEASF